MLLLWHFSDIGIFTYVNFLTFFRNQNLDIVIDSFKMDVDCGERVCHTEFKILPTCHLYVETPNSNCSIPCVLEPCKVEIYHNIRCPLIFCQDKTTTTMGPFTTISPTPLPDCSGPLCYSSLSVNIVLTIAVLLGVIFGAKYIKKLKQRHEYSALEEMPIMRGYSNAELNERRESHSLENQNAIDPAEAENAETNDTNQTQHPASFTSRLRSFFRFFSRTSHPNQIV